MRLGTSLVLELMAQGIVKPTDDPWPAVDLILRGKATPPQNAYKPDIKAVANTWALGCRTNGVRWLRLAFSDELEPGAGEAAGSIPVSAQESDAAAQSPTPRSWPTRTALPSATSGTSQGQRNLPGHRSTGASCPMQLDSGGTSSLWRSRQVRRITARRSRRVTGRTGQLYLRAAAAAAATPCCPISTCSLALGKLDLSRSRARCPLDWLNGNAALLAEEVIPPCAWCSTTRPMRPCSACNSRSYSEQGGPPRPNC
jgi:hypothetical protein